MNWLLIAIGGAVGSVARYGTYSLLLRATDRTQFPWGTLAANLIGGYLIGICIAVFQAMPQLDPVWRLALVTGFLGGLTTFSSFSAEVVIFLMDARYGLAALTATVHVLGSLLMTVAGLKSAMFLLAANAR